MPHSNARYQLADNINANDKTDCLVIGTWNSPKNSKAKKYTTSVPAKLAAQLASLAKSGDVQASAGAVSLIHNPAGVGAQRLLLVGMGEARGDAVSAHAYVQACQAASKQLASLSLKKATITLHLAKVAKRDAVWAMQLLVRLCNDARYHFDGYFSPKPAKPSPLSAILPRAKASGAPSAKAQSQAIARAQAISLGESACRDLANTPPNVCTPEYLARQARALGARHKSLKVEILDEKALAKERMNTLLAVAQGSRNPPRLALIHFRPKGASAKPIVLVGKGVTFDTGGISLKPAQAMDEMKFDMCGAASVFGAMRAIAEMGIKRHVIGLMVCVENMPGGKATRPGDIVRSRAGINVEILNTDAEGRLILCDALDYVKRYKPETVIDIATLTGACVVALGKVASGLMSNDKKLALKLKAASKQAHDAVWRLPLWQEYSEQLKSPVADLANIGGRDAGTITAACYLWRFCEDYRWAHLDIAGTAWLSPPQKAATGRPVPLLCQYLVNEAGS